MVEKYKSQEEILQIVNNDIKVEEKHSQTMCISLSVNF